MENTPIDQVPAEQVSERSAIKELWHKANEGFYAKKEDFVNYLRRQNIWDERAYPKVVEKIKERKNLTEEEKREIIEEIRKRLLELANLGIKNDANLYEGIMILESLGEVGLIRERVNRGHRMITGELHYDLAKAILEYGDDGQSEAMLRDWLKERGQTNLTDFEDTKYFQERLFIINNSFNAFAKAHGLPDNCLTCHMKDRGRD